MSRNFCDLIREEYYTGAELGRRLEVRLGKEGLKHRQYYKGEMVRLLNQSGIKSVDGKWLGKDVIPVMKAEFERVKNSPKNKKAKSTGKQTSQKISDTESDVLTIPNISHQMSIEEIPFTYPDFTTLKEKLIEAADLITKALEETIRRMTNG